jgi:hypothetical protein
MPPSVSQNQLSKLNQLDQPIVQPANSQPVYNLEYIFNKIKDIGRQVQLIRIERRGIIYGNKLWELLGKILGESEINSDLVAELKNYEFNVQVLNSIEKRILSVDNPNPDVTPFGPTFTGPCISLINILPSAGLSIIGLMVIGLFMLFGLSSATTLTSNAGGGIVDIYIINNIIIFIILIILNNFLKYAKHFTK